MESKEFSQLADDKEIEALIQRKDFSSAERLLLDRIQDDPSHPDHHYLLGVAKYLQGRIGEAIEPLKKSLELDPRHTDAAICLSVLYNDIGRYDEAKKVFELANHSINRPKDGRESEIDRKFAIKHFELGDLYFRYRRYDEAIEEYSKAAVLSPSNLEIRIRRAKAFAKKGFLTRAIQELQQLKSESPRFLSARIQLGLLHYSQGNVLDAEIEWEAILEIDSEHREAAAYLEMAKGARLKNQPN